MNLRLLSTKRLFAALCFFVTCFIIYLSVSQSDPVCFFDKEWKDGKTLEPVQENLRLRSHDNPKNVFFHETSCTKDGIIKLNSRQACAIESTAKMNPDHEIFVLFTSQVGFRNITSLPIIDALRSYPNINFNYLNLTQYAQHTPLANWMKTGELFRSAYVNSHTSDILRYLSLWKYSGTYLDLDIVMMKSLNVLKPNYAGAESKNFVAAGIINLEGETGHEIADLCVKDLLKNFNGNDWGNNGPGVITRVLHGICNTNEVLKMISAPKQCRNFRVLPIESCYSIRWPEHMKFFKEEFLNETMERLQDSIIAHVWNKHSAATSLTIDSNVAYVHLARKFCPRVIKASEFF